MLNMQHLEFAYFFGSDYNGATYKYVLFVTEKKKDEKSKTACTNDYSDIAVRIS